MKNDKLAGFQYLWDGSEAGWGLLKCENGEFGITNNITKSGLLIEDNKVFKALIKKMLDQKVPIFQVSDLIE